MVYPPVGYKLVEFYRITMLQIALIIVSSLFGYFWDYLRLPF